MLALVNAPRHAVPVERREMPEPTPADDEAVVAVADWQAVTSALDLLLERKLAGKAVMRVS